MSKGKKHPNEIPQEKISESVDYEPSPKTVKILNGIITFGAVVGLLGMIWVAVYNNENRRLDTMAELMSYHGEDELEQEADPNKLVDDIKVKIDDKYISYQELNENNCQAGVVDCHVFYASDIVAPKNAYIVFSDQIDEPTFEGEEYFKITVPKGDNSNE